MRQFSKIADQSSTARLKRADAKAHRVGADISQREWFWLWEQVPKEHRKTLDGASLWVRCKVLLRFRTHLARQGTFHDPDHPSCKALAAKVLRQAEKRARRAKRAGIFEPPADFQWEATPEDQGGEDPHPPPRLTFDATGQVVDAGVAE